MSRKKSLTPQSNDPIQEAKQKMLERKVRRKKVAAVVAEAATTSPIPDSNWAGRPPALPPLETWQQKDPTRERIEAKVKKLELEYWAETEAKARELMEGMKPHPIPPGYAPSTILATSTKLPEIGMSEAATKAWREKFEAAYPLPAPDPTPVPDHLPVVILQVDRPITPKDALGPEPGIVRQILLGTAEWPRHLSIAKSSLSHYDERAVRYCFEEDRLYFWLANGCAVYDVAETPDGLWLEGDLLCGTVFPLTPKE